MVFKPFHVCCKRKQYNTVRCLSVLLFGIAEKYVTSYELCHRLTTNDHAKTASPPIGPHERAPRGPEGVTALEDGGVSEPDAVRSVLLAEEAESAHLELQQFLHAACGSPLTLSHEGPIGVNQLHSLQRLSVEAVRHLFQFFAATLLPLRSRCATVHGGTTGERENTRNTTPTCQNTSKETTMGTGGRMQTDDGVISSKRAYPYPTPTPLYHALWSGEETRARYIENLCDARERKVQCSVDLTKPGYLEEAGLHALRVFSPSCRSGEEPHVTEDNKEEAVPSSAPPLLCRGSSTAPMAGSTEGKSIWTDLIDRYTLFLPDRSNIHELENLPQEIAIGELVSASVKWILAEEVDRNAAGCGAGASVDLTTSTLVAGSESWLDHIVDVGGGNGFLAAALAERLGCDATLIDPYYPSHSIDCCPRLWPDTPGPQRRRPARRRRQALHRRLAVFREVVPLWCSHRFSPSISDHFPHGRSVSPPPPADIAALTPHVPFSTEAKEERQSEMGGFLGNFWYNENRVGVSSRSPRIALVAKHLCGTAVDQCLRHLEEQCCSLCSPVVLVLAPCCFHRCVYNEYIYKDFLTNVLHINEVSVFETLCCLTAWNKSVYQAVRANSTQVNSGSGNYSRNILAGDLRLNRPERSPSPSSPLSANEENSLHPRLFSSIQRSSSTRDNVYSVKKKKSVESLIPSAEAIMEGVEHLFNFGRELWLHERGYKTAYVEYVPRCVTPKNKCIVAYRFPSSATEKY